MSPPPAAPPPAAPPPASPPAGRPSEAAARTIRDLRAELEATKDPKRQAVIHYQLGVVLEHEAGNDGQAVREYLGAFNLDESFRPPLVALTRIFERRRSFKNLGKLYEAEMRTAHDDRDRAAALVDRAALLDDHLKDPGGALDLLDQALDAEPTSGLTALALERSARRAGDDELVIKAIGTLAAVTGDPTLKTLLVAEAARAHEAQGDVDEALRMLEEAAKMPVARWRTFEAMDAMARRHGKQEAVVTSLEARARLAAAHAEGDAPYLGSGAFSLLRFQDEASATARSAALWYQAARVRALELDDAEGAVEAMGKALFLAPDDLLYRQVHMAALERAGEHEKAAADARALIERGATGRLAATLHYKLAEQARRNGDLEAAEASLAAALDADPKSVVARAALDDQLLADEKHEERVRCFIERAEANQGDARALALWRAGQITNEKLGDFERAQTLYRSAADTSTAPAAILRELYGAALRKGAADVALEVSAVLLGCELEPEERGALLRDRYVLLDGDPDQRARAAQTLTHAVGDPSASRWALDAARLSAALSGDARLLARAHRALADGAEDERSAAAHLAAAGRALARADDDGGAIECLRAALERLPGHRYAVTLLEELLLARGEADEAVALLRQAAIAGEGARAAEAALLLAGAAAEATGDAALAASTYREASTQNVDSPGALWPLLRLALEQGDAATALEARTEIARREVAVGSPGLGSLELGEHHAFSTAEANLAAAALSPLLDQPERAAYAAALLLLLDPAGVDPELQSAAARRLLDGAGDDDRFVLERLAGTMEATADPTGAEAAARAARVEALDPTDPWGPLDAIRASAGRPDRDEERAEAFGLLGANTSDVAVGAELLLHGLRARLVALGEDASDDAFLLAQEVVELADASAAAATAVDESLAGGDDPEARAEAFAMRLSHAGNGMRAPLEAARGRALAAAGRPPEAVEALREVVRAHPDDLGSWDALRVAARDARAWEDVARACDELAKAASGSFEARLLEEAGAVAMDFLEQDDVAERRLRAALALDAGSDIAYGRLHDLLAEQERTEELLALVVARTEVTDEEDALARLFYEQARLLRSLGRRDDALGALENLWMLDEEHAGGIALAVEIHVSRESWAEAVDALRRLADSDVPASQKRIARLGAADFLENKLGDANAALEELRAVEALGLADVKVYNRMADIAERSSVKEEAVQWLDRALEAGVTGEGRVQLAKRAGALRVELGYNAGAVHSYRVALETAPNDLEAAAAVADLLTDPAELRQHSADFEAAVREDLEANLTDQRVLRKLRAAAWWRGDAGLEDVVLQVLVALGGANEEELNARDQHTQMVRMTTPAPELARRTVDRLRAPGDGGPLARLVELAGEALAAAGGMEPAKYGVGRSELVGSRSNHPMRAQVTHLSSLVGLEVADLHVGGDDPDRVLAFPAKKGRISWVIGADTVTRLDTFWRYEGGYQAAVVRAGSAALVDRSPEDAATLIFALCEAAEAPLAASVGRPGLNEWSRAIGRALSRKSKKAIPEIVGRVPDGGRGVEAYCEALKQTARRAGLLISTDLGATLSLVLGETPSRDRIEASAQAMDLLRFWLSPEAGALRKELGLFT